MKKAYYVFETELGWVGIAGSDGRISRLNLPRETLAEAVGMIAEGTSGQFVETFDDFSGVAGLIKDYFAGKRVEFDCELDLSGRTEFQRAVWPSVGKFLSERPEVTVGSPMRSGVLPGCGQLVRQWALIQCPSSFRAIAWYALTAASAGSVPASAGKLDCLKWSETAKRMGNG